jgi:hypothetical protein
MFALVHKNRVLVGPMDWNRALFDGALSRLGISTTLPRVSPEFHELPWVIDENTSVCFVEFNYPEYNQKIHYLEGPYWTFENGKAIAGYLVKDQPVESVQYNLKQLAAEYRWHKEISGTKVVVQEIEVTVDTDRNSRNIFVQQYLLMSDTDTVRWKFPEAWLTLTKSELGLVVSAGAAHIQNAFLWESMKVEEINTATTLQQLDSIVIGE